MCSGNARVLGVGIQGYSLWGSSAGARMAAAIGSHGVARFGGDVLPKPSAVVMAYTGHSEYGANEPSTFAVVGEHDGIAPPSVMERRVAALRKTSTDVEFHRYDGLGHGFGPGTGTTRKDGWTEPSDFGRGRYGEVSGGRRMPCGKASGPRKHEEERVPERRVCCSADRREDQGARRLAGHDAQLAPHFGQGSRSRSRRGVEVERGSGVVARRNDLAPR